jgi:hypothetical protein
MHILEKMMSLSSENKDISPADVDSFGIHPKKHMIKKQHNSKYCTP